MLGSDYANVGWPECGEIDLMELVNSGTTYHVTLHGPQGESDYSNGEESAQVVPSLISRMISMSTGWIGSATASP